MPGLALAWRYLTGHAVATDLSSLDRPEWPPHPARVFMALAAAWFETEPDADSGEARSDWDGEGEALRWLEQLGDPLIVAPSVDRIGVRRSVTVFVPVNDDDALRKPSSAPLQSAPSLTRSRQPRSFPQVWVGEQPCCLSWPDVDPEQLAPHRSALERLCAKVTRIGHSSSLVEMWVEHAVPQAERIGQTWEPDDLAAELRVRPIGQGMLAMLQERYGEAVRRKAEELEREIERLKEEKRRTRGRGAHERKQELQRRIEQLKAERELTHVRSPLRPSIGLWRGYRRRERASAPKATASGRFDSDMLVFALGERPVLPAAATLLATAALRNTILGGVHDHLCGCGAWQQGAPPLEEAHQCWANIPAWVSGHEHDGSPLRSGDHLAIVALPFVASRHADGHLLGLALVFPRAIDRKERARVLGPVLRSRDGRPRSLRLTLGRAGVVEAALKDPGDARVTLQPATWTAVGRGGSGPPGSRAWASATPVVLDRFPKKDRCAEHEAWSQEVRGLIASSCERVGLPEPALVEIGTTSWLLGSPRACLKRRRLRTGRQEAQARAHGPLGDGFPSLSAGTARPPRPQVHARIVFSVPVVGPVLIGAGRYRGYGLFRPVPEGPPCP